MSQRGSNGHGLAGLIVGQPGGYSHSSLAFGGGSGNPPGMDAKIARLESDVAHIQRDVTEIKGDLRDMRKDVVDLRKELHSAKLWVLVLMGTGYASLIAVMAKGFGWLK